MDDDTKIPVDCSECGHKFTKRAGYLKTSPTFCCPGCGVSIKINGDSIRRSIDRFRQQNLLNTRREIKIKFKF